MDVGTKKISVLGSHYTLQTQTQIYESILAAALARKNGYVCVANVHTTMMGVFDSAYRRITNAATFAVPDGMPLVWAMRSLGAKDQDRVRGPTLMRDLCARGREAGLKHYLYGGSPAALQSLRQKLESLYPGLQIVGAESPPYRPLDEISLPDWQRAAEKINASGAQLVWVGLGAPKQEKWMWEQRDRVQGMMVGVGAAFDLLAESIPEAPLGMQRLGLEWLYRLYREPRRLWRRYLFNNPAFLLLWGGQWLRERIYRKQ